MLCAAGHDASDHTQFVQSMQIELFLVAFTVYSFIYPKLINAYKLICAVYTFMSASGSYTFPHMLPEVTPERCTFYNGAEAV